MRKRVERGKGGRDRNVFHPTAKGRRAFEQWLAGADDERDEVAYDFLLGHPFLTKCLFFNRLTPAEVSAKFEDQLADCTRKARDVQVDPRAHGRARSGQSPRRGARPGNRTTEGEGAMAEANDPGVEAAAGAEGGMSLTREIERRAIDMWAPIVPSPDVMRHVVAALPARDGRLPARLLQARARRRPSSDARRRGMQMSDEDSCRRARRRRHRADADHRFRRVVERAARPSSRTSWSPASPSATRAVHPVCRRRRPEAAWMPCASSSSWCAAAASAGSACGRS